VKSTRPYTPRDTTLDRGSHSLEGGRPDPAHAHARDAGPSAPTTRMADEMALPRLSRSIDAPCMNCHSVRAIAQEE
jgi:hypothetical protein